MRRRRVPTQAVGYKWRAEVDKNWRQLVNVMEHEPVAPDYRSPRERAIANKRQLDFIHILLYVSPSLSLSLSSLVPPLPLAPPPPSLFLLSPLTYLKQNINLKKLRVAESSTRSPWPKM